MNDRSGRHAKHQGHSDATPGGADHTNSSAGAERESSEEDLWRDAYGAYGFSRGDEPADPAVVIRRPEDRMGASGYGAQGFGVGEQRGPQWGGGVRGGYGGGLPGRDSADPNDPRATRGRAWGERGRPRRGS